MSMVKCQLFLMWLFKGLILFFLGLALVIYRERVQAFTGDIGFAEKYLGTGGTFTFYLFLGIGTMIFSILYVTGASDAFIDNTVGRIFFRPE